MQKSDRVYGPSPSFAFMEHPFLGGKIWSISVRPRSTISGRVDVDLEAATGREATKEKTCIYQESHDMELGGIFVVYQESHGVGWCGWSHPVSGPPWIAPRLPPWIAPRLVTAGFIGYMRDMNGFSPSDWGSQDWNWISHI